MNRETEIKLPVEDIEQATKRILSLGAKPKKERHFEENLVFDTESRELLNQGVLLRLRITVTPGVNNIGAHSAPAQGLVTFKGKVDLSNGVRDREEIECIIQEPENIIRIFSNLGLFPVFRYQKYRTVYHIQNVPLEFCVDETPIGNYVELEGDIGSIHEYATRLGFSKDQFVTESYGGLYLKWCEEKGFKPANMVFP
jgi:adenylate cyclase, class 2